MSSWKPRAERACSISRFLNARLISLIADGFNPIARYIRRGVCELIGGAAEHYRDGSPAAAEVSGLPRLRRDAAGQPPGQAAWAGCGPPPPRHGSVPLFCRRATFDTVWSSCQRSARSHYCASVEGHVRSSRTRTSSARPDTLGSRTHRTADPAW